jgi:heme exporter protein C
MERPHALLLRALLAVTAVAMLAALYLVFLWAPDEKVMGAVQRIFYFHVPAAFVAFLSTFVLLAGCIGYLWTRRPAFDHLARAATELALLFCLLVLTTGPIWAKPAWGVWWTWEAKLTTTLLLALLLAGALLVRSYAENPEQGARIAAVLGIVAALDVPIIHKAVDWWRGQHPIVFGPGKAAPLDPRMRTALLVCLGVFFVLYLLLLALRFAILAAERRAQVLSESVASEGSAAR